MERGTTQFEGGEISTASADAGIQPATPEPGHAVDAPQSASARAREFEWSLATYFGQSFVVFAYRAPERG
jgi:hypothetical protein